MLKFVRLKLKNDWDWQGARQKFRRSLELNPNYATSYQAYALYFAAMDKREEAKREIQKARDLGPCRILSRLLPGISSILLTKTNSL